MFVPILHSSFFVLYLIYNTLWFGDVPIHFFHVFAETEDVHRHIFPMCSTELMSEPRHLSIPYRRMMSFAFDDFIHEFVGLPHCCQSEVSFTA